MLEKLRKIALEKFASEAEADAFMSGFEKEAFLGMSPRMMVDVRSAMGPNLAKAAVGLGAALIGATILKGISSGSGAITNYGLRNKFELALAQVMANNKIVRGSNPAKAKQYAETIFRFAPNVASDANLLSSVLANAVLGEGVDPQTIKTLVDLEGRYADNSKPAGLPGIKF